MGPKVVQLESMEWQNSKNRDVIIPIDVVREFLDNQCTYTTGNDGKRVMIFGFLLKEEEVFIDAADNESGVRFSIIRRDVEDLEQLHVDLAKQTLIYQLSDLNDAEYKRYRKEEDLKNAEADLDALTRVKEILVKSQRYDQAAELRDMESRLRTAIIENERKN